MTATFIAFFHPVPAVLMTTGSALLTHRAPTPLFLIIFELISLILRRVMIRRYSHQRFYRDTVSRKIASQDRGAQPAHATRLFLAGRQPSI